MRRYFDSRTKTNKTYDKGKGQCLGILYFLFAHWKYSKYVFHFSLLSMLQILTLPYNLFDTISLSGY